MEGTWTIHWADDDGFVAQGANAIVTGPKILVADPVVPVVPCDDAAVERAVTALLQDSGLPIYGGYRATIERRVLLALRAAGETP